MIPLIEWSAFSDDIDAILALKRERTAVIPAHNNQTPEILHCVADIVGDRLALARKAMTVDADIIVLAGVHFMADSASFSMRTRRCSFQTSAPAARWLTRSRPQMSGCCASVTRLFQS